jgi:hypothetical protein
MQISTIIASNSNCRVHAKRRLGRNAANPKELAIFLLGKMLVSTFRYLWYYYVSTVLYGEMCNENESGGVKKKKIARPPVDDDSSKLLERAVVLQLPSEVASGLLYQEVGYRDPLLH